MSRRYWLSLIAAVGLALTVYVDAKPVEKAASGNGNTAQIQTQGAIGTPPTGLSAIRGDTERMAKALEVENIRADSREEKQNTADNLKAQRDMADAAGRAVIVGGVEAIITFIGVILVALTLSATKRAAAAAEKTVHAMLAIDRPYLWAETFEVGDVKKDLVNCKGQKVALIHLFGAVRNRGTRFARLDGFAAAEVSRGLCLPVPEVKEVDILAPHLIGPGSLQSWSESLASFEIEAERFQQIMDGKLQWNIYGFFRYSDANGTSRSTGFAFEFFRGELFEGGRIELYPSGPSEYWYDVENQPKQHPRKPAWSTQLTALLARLGG